MRKKIIKILQNDNALTLSTQVMSAGLGLIAFIILARWMERSAFGLWLLYLTAFNFMEMLRAGMLHQAIVRNISVIEDEKNKKQMIGSSWAIALLFSLVLCFLLAAVAFFAPGLGKQSGLELFFMGYPLVIWFTLPLSMAQWIKHAEQDFMKMGVITVMGSLIFLGTLLVCIAYLEEISELLVFSLHTLSRLMTSLFVMLYNWSRLRYLRFFRKDMMIQQFHFGKFSMITLIGTNLLKSADVFIIGYFLGPVMVAVYSLPLKLIEIAEMPLRALTTTAFPKLSKLYATAQYEQLLKFFGNQVFVLSAFLLIPLVLGQLLAEPIIRILGGEEYLDGVWVLRIFMFFIFFLPIDRLSGILLDSIGKPQINTLKVGIMVLVNILGDLVAVLVFESLWMVALVTILNVLFGIMIAMLTLQKTLPLKVSTFFPTNPYQQFKQALQGVF